jgi:RNA polymerase sigma-70 factor (ECF subfamily)
VTQQLDAGRRARYEAVFTEVYEPLQRYLRRRAPEAVADDVLSTVLLVLWRRLDDVPTDTAIPWAYGVARRTLANERRGEHRRLRLVSRLQRHPPVPSEPVDDDGELDAALAALGEVDREVVRLWAWEGLAPREIATVLGITPNAASIRLHRAKARLAAGLAAGKDRAPAGHDDGGRREEAS